VKADSEAVRVAAIREILDRGYGRPSPLVPGYDDVLAHHHPDHGGTITIEFIDPTNQPNVIDGRPSREVNGSGH
jgi:hypothetical protein